MKRTPMLQKRFREKELIVFDLDGTLAPSKAPMEASAAALMRALLAKKRIAVIGGGKYELFKMQLLSRLRTSPELLKNLPLFPTNATAWYHYRGTWKKMYEHTLSRQEKAAIRRAFKTALREVHYIPPPKVYGVVLEDRKTQMSFSPLGQEIVAVLGKKGIRMKEEWKEKNDRLRFEIARRVAKQVPSFEVRVGGITTIDVTRKGIDKAYGIRQIEKELKIPRKKMLFVGDAIYPGGNDYAIVKAGVDYVKVKTHKDTERVMRFLLR